MMPPACPLLIFDGDCSFCKRWIARWKNLTGDAIDYEPAQTAAARFPEIPKEEFGRSVFLIGPDGSHTRAARAVFESLALAGRKRFLLWLYRHVGPFAWASEAAYRFIAAHRDGVDRIDRVVIGTETRPIVHRLTRAVFLRLLGVIYLIAFWSLSDQFDGLVGSNGILPAWPYLDAVTNVIGTRARWWELPTLAYLSPNDHFMHVLCAAGIIGAIGLIVGVLPLLMTSILWACYLSLVVIGQKFLSFQWDALLLEAGFLAILWSPPLWAGPKTRHEPSRIVLLLFRWLLFRLMFLSALTKWTAGDQSWRDMTALRYHFETQPLPTWTSWYAHHSPHWMLSLSCAIMFFIEFVVPFFYFCPRRTRLLGFWLTVLLQVNIMATGNYGFFNLLAIVLAFTLLDDAAIAWIFRIRAIPPRRIDIGRPVLRYVAVYPITLLLVVLTTMELVDTWQPVDWPKALAAMKDYAAPFRSTNSYGLFRVMTKERPELAVEGSNDGITWKEYVFRYKMGDVNRRPQFVIGHMPRLDWQMWFAALGDRDWLANLAYRLLSGQKEVLDLLADNPFPDRAPKYLRVVEYDYRFSDRGSSAWWVRKPIGVIMGPLSISRDTPTDRNFKL